jgi:dTDP-4-amino-4,6-dideoxygalactose transaminase
MNDIQAALGINQMKRIDKTISRRHEIARKYDRELADLPLVTPWQAPNFYSSYHLYNIVIKNDSNNKSQRQYYDELWEREIAINLHYIPVHRQPYYENLGFKIDDFPVAEQFHRETISIPMYASLKDEDQDYVIENLKKVALE